MLEIGAALVGQSQRARSPHEQRHAEARLKLLNALAERRLPPPRRPSGGAESPGLDHRDEGPELLERMFRLVRHAFQCVSPRGNCPCPPWMRKMTASTS